MKNHSKIGKLVSFFCWHQPCRFSTLTQATFKEKYKVKVLCLYFAFTNHFGSGLSLNNVLLFSDELPDNHDECKDVVRFLRNLCRVVNIPSMLSGTNSRVTNLIGKRDSRNSGPSIDEGLTPWVKVVTKTPHNPKALLKCLGCSIDVRLWNRKVKLKHYIDKGEIDVDRLLLIWWK